MFKRKRKTAYGEAEVESINWPLIAITLIVTLLACALLYVLLYPVLFGGNDEPEYVIVPFGEDDGDVSPLPPTGTIPLTPDLPPTFTSPPATPVPPVTLPITADTVAMLRLLEQLSGHSTAVSSVVYSPDGRLLASGDRDGIIRLWNTGAGAGTVELYTFRSASNWVNSVSFSRDSRTLAAGGQDNVVRLWDVTTGTEIGSLTGPGGSINSVAFSPVDDRLAAGSDDGTIHIWDVSDPAQPVPVVVLEGLISYVTSVAFSPDGRLLAAGSEDDTVRLWSIPDGTPVSVLLGHRSNVAGVAFSPDGSRLASIGADQAIRLWNVTALAAMETNSIVLEGHTENLNSVAFSPNGGLLASAAGGIEDNTVRLWDPVSGAELGVIYPSGPVNSIAFRPDGMRLAVGGATFLSIWGAQAGGSVQAATSTSQTAQPTATIIIEYGTPAPPTSADECVLIVGDETITTRTGPGTSYDAVGTLPPGMSVAAVGWIRGTEEGFTWWRLTNQAWLRGDQLANVNDLPDPCWALPLLSDPAAPVPTSAPIVPSTPQLTVTPWPTVPVNTGGATCILTAQLPDVNARTGPTRSAEIVSKLAEGQQVTAVGWTTGEEGFTWWQLADGSWVRADTVEFPADCLALPQVTP
ncbi:MAG: hypothetical protein JXQ72_06430 [Anaerolineae bacterium]|nr:hypothetical protein [Anaerolineae bacterium]